MSLSLDEIQNVVLLFSNPVWAGQNTIPSTIIRNITALSDQLAYSEHVTENLTVLVSKYSQTDNGVLSGLLYVPDLQADDPCKILERDFVPSSAVRQVNLPPTNYNLIAIAPWFNNNCTKSYLASARLDPLRAFIFFRPSNHSSKPPPVTSTSWNLNDNGAWKTENHYPILAVPGLVGASMMHQLSLYSGNLSDVPFGQNITALYNPDPADYVRVWTELSVSTPTGLPNVWVFILAVVGVLLLVITTTSFTMHWTWRRRRRALRRRVIEGEVNLEAAGIRRLTVPLVHIQKFPLFTYHYEPDLTSPPTSPTSPRPPQRTRTRRSSRGADTIVTSTLSDRSQLAGEKGLASPVAPSLVATDLDYQPACPICLETYENRTTIIRELSCGHIYHPDCIDEFLSQNSSLCPTCKASMLPRGYCPPITNSMVRRERATRRLRGRILPDDSDPEDSDGRRHSWRSSWKRRFLSANHRSNRSSNTDPEPVAEPRPATRDLGASSRAELTRRRMHELAGSDVESDEGRVSFWRGLRRNVFPGFR